MPEGAAKGTKSRGAAGPGPLELPLPRGSSQSRQSSLLVLPSGPNAASVLRGSETLLAPVVEPASAGGASPCPAHLCTLKEDEDLCLLISVSLGDATFNVAQSERHCILQTNHSDFRIFKDFGIKSLNLELHYLHMFSIFSTI